MRDDGTASGDKPTIEDVGGRSDGDASVPCDCRKEDAMTTETVAASGPVDDRGSCSALPVDDVLQAQTSSASDATHHGQVPVTHAGAKFGFAQTVVEGTVGRSNMPDSDEIPSCINDVPHGTSDGKRIEADREDYPTSTSPKPAQQLPPGGFDESHPKQNDLCCDPSCKGSVQEDRGLQKTADTCTIPSGDQDTWHADSQTDLEVPGARGGIEVDSSTREVSQVDSGDSRKCGLQTGTSCSTEGITDHDLELRAKAGLEGTAADLGHRVRPDVMHGCIEPGKAAEHALAEPAHSLVAATFGTQAPESPFFHPAPSPIDGVLSDSPLEPSQLQGKVTLSASDAKVPTTPPASAHPQSYQIGDRVEYWSKTIGAWIPGLIRNCHEQNGAMTVYDLDCKKGARVEMIRLRQKPRQRVVTASKKAADTRAVTRKHSSLAHGGSARGLEKGPIGKDSKKKAASPPGSMGPADGSRNTLRKSHVAGSERNREKRSSGNDADELVHRFKRELAEVQDASFQARRQAAAKTVAEAQTRDTRRRKRAGKAAWQTIKGLLEDACVAGGSGESPREKNDESASQASVHSGPSRGGSIERRVKLVSCRRGRRRKRRRKRRRVEDSENGAESDVVEVEESENESVHQVKGRSQRQIDGSFVSRRGNTAFSDSAESGQVFVDVSDSSANRGASGDWSAGDMGEEVEESPQAPAWEHRSEHRLRSRWSDSRREDVRRRRR